MSTAPIPNFALASFSQAGSFATDALLSDGDDVVSRKGTLASGKYVRGQILSITPSTGAIVPAVIGSAAPNCILAENADATGGSVEALVYLSGKFKADQITWPAAGAHADHTDLLRDYGILIESVEGSTGATIKSVPTEADAAEAKKTLEENRKRTKEPPAKTEVPAFVGESPWGYMTPEEKEKMPWLADPPVQEQEQEEDSEKKHVKASHERPPQPPVRPPEKSK
jgi:hypothetical protein